MKVYNENKTEILNDCDLDKGTIVNEVYNGEIVLVYKPFSQELLKIVEQSKIQGQIQECLQYLRDTDYIANKFAEVEVEYIATGDNTEILALRERYAEELATRKNKREKIRELENLLKVE